MDKILFISMGGTAEKGWNPNADQNGYSESSRVFNYLEERTGINGQKMITICQSESTDITPESRIKLYETILANRDFKSVVIVHGENGMPETAKKLLGYTVGVEGKTIVGVSANIPIGCEGNDVLLLLGYAAACSQLLPAGIYFCKKPFEYVEMGKWKK